MITRQSNISDQVLPDTVWCDQVPLLVPTALLHQHHTNSCSKTQDKNTVWSSVFMHLGCYSWFVLDLSPVSWRLLVLSLHQRLCNCTCQQNLISVITVICGHVSQSIFTHVTLKKLQNLLINPHLSTLCHIQNWKPVAVYLLCTYHITNQWLTSNW
jgi:hypothetical protein